MAAYDYGSYLPPELELQKQQLNRQQEMAKALLTQGQQMSQGPAGQMVSGQYVANSPWAMLNGPVNQLVGAWLGSKGDESATKLATALRERETADIQQYNDLYKGREATPEVRTELAGPYGANVGEGLSVPKPEAVTPAKAAVAANPDQANLFAASSYSPILRQMGLKRMTEGPKWEKTEKLDARGNSVNGLVDVNSPNPESTFRPIGIGKQAISPEAAARLSWEGIPYGGGGGGSTYSMPTGNAPQMAPQGGTSPVIRPVGNQVSIATNAPSYAQNAVTMPNAGGNANVPMVPTVNFAGMSPKARQEALTEQGKELQANVKNAYEVYKVAGDIEKLLPEAHGSGIGAGMGYMANMLNMESPQNVADEKLKVLSSRILMQVPRFQGPQSDKDVAVYKEAAGSLADPTKSIDSRMGALQVIKDMNSKYAPNLDWSYGKEKPATEAPKANQTKSQAVSIPRPAGIDENTWKYMDDSQKALFAPRKR